LVLGILVMEKNKKQLFHSMLVLLFLSFPIFLQIYMFLWLLVCVCRYYLIF